MSKIPHPTLTRFKHWLNAVRIDDKCKVLAYRHNPTTFLAVLLSGRSIVIRYRNVGDNMIFKRKDKEIILRFRSATSPWESVEYGFTEKRLSSFFSTTPFVGSNNASSMPKASRGKIVFPMPSLPFHKFSLIFKSRHPGKCFFRMDVDVSEFSTPQCAPTNDATYDKSGNLKSLGNSQCLNSTRWGT